MGVEMIIKICSLQDLSFEKLMTLYKESILENAKDFYPKLDISAGILEAEQDFYAYLRDVFFKTNGACYYILEKDEQYVSGLRIEPYMDGYLIEALETDPEYRCKGYATYLLCEVASKSKLPLYSHISKTNAASLSVHRRCGFKIILNYAEYIDGSQRQNSYTLCRQPHFVTSVVELP